MSVICELNDPDLSDRDDNCGALACLLRHDGAALRKASRTVRETREQCCMLTRSLPRCDKPVVAFRQTSVRATDPAGGDHAGTIYQPGPRITGVDRAIIRAYFQGPGVGAAASWTGTDKPSTRGTGDFAPDAAEFLPMELERRLTVVPHGYYRLLRRGAVILVDSATGNVIDAVRKVAVRNF